MAKVTARTAFITGASSGIGAGLARQLAAQGVHVVLAARRQDKLEEVAESIVAEGGKAEVAPLDVTDPDKVAETMTRFDDSLSGIDLVIANAGLVEGRWSGKLDWSSCEKTLRVNVIGATATLTALLPRMAARKSGHLVGISSLAGVRGLPKMAVYSGSKAYLSTFLESLRVDLRRAGVTVTDIRPGFVKTALTESSGKLPFMLSVEAAAAEIVSAIASKKGVHAFPMPLTTAVRAMKSVPNPIYDRVIGR